MEVGIISYIVRNRKISRDMITDPDQDPMGAAVWAYYNGNLDAEIQVYSDVAVDDVIPVKYLFRTTDQMPELEQIALEKCRGNILDIGAGAGSHSLHLQQLGYKVTAIDISPGATSLMKARGIDNAVHVDINSFDIHTFDTLLMMMNGIGLVGDLKGLNHFFEYLSKHMKPGAQLLLDSSDIAYLYETLEIEYPQQSYYGIIKYQMCFKQIQGLIFDWLYIDYPRLKKHADFYGFSCDLVAEGKHFDYLACLYYNK